MQCNVHADIQQVILVYDLVYFYDVTCKIIKVHYVSFRSCMPGDKDFVLQTPFTSDLLSETIGRDFDGNNLH